MRTRPHACNDLCMPDTDLIDSVEAAAILNISRPTLTRWVQAGRFETTFELGGARVFSRREVEALAASKPADGAA